MAGLLEMLLPGAPPGALLGNLVPPSSPDVLAPQPGADSGGGAPSTSLLGRIAGGIGGAISNNPQTLLKMAAGFAGAPSLGTGMSRAFAGASEGIKSDQTQQALGTTYQALVKAGIPSAQAMAAVAAAQAGNPAMLQGLAHQMFAPAQPWQGGAEAGVFHPSTGAITGRFVPQQPLTWQGSQGRDPITGAVRAQEPPKLVTIQDPNNPGQTTSALQHSDGRIERIDPGRLPSAETPPVQVYSFEDALRLPPGTRFRDPMGILRTR